MDLARTEDEKQIISVVSLPSSIGYAYWVAPTVPAARVASLQKAYDLTMKDPEFIADARELKLLIRPRSAEEMHTLIANAVAIPKPVIERAVKILEWQ
jgi:hypothetical protein